MTGQSSARALEHRLCCPKGLVLLFSQEEGQGQLLQLLVAACREELSPWLCQAMPGAQGKCPSPANPSLPPGWAVCLCFCGQYSRLSPHSSEWLRFQCHSAGSVKKPVPGAARPFPLPTTIVSPLLSTKPREDHLLMQKLQSGLILLVLQSQVKMDKRS